MQATVWSIAMSRCRYTLYLAALAATSIAFAAFAQDPPYRVIEGAKADPAVRQGYSVYLASCMACHGEDALGTAAAPSLVDSMRAMQKQDFRKIVREGRERKDGDQDRIMPPFADDAAVASRLDQLYAYLKARSDGALLPGRPKPLQ